MGISQSAETTSDTDTENTGYDSKSSSAASGHNIFAIFNSAKHDELLDSTDSEITLEDPQYYTNSSFYKDKYGVDINIDETSETDLTNLDEKQKIDPPKHVDRVYKEVKVEQRTQIDRGDLINSGDNFKQGDRIISRDKLLHTGDLVDQGNRVDWDDLADVSDLVNLGVGADIIDSGESGKRDILVKASYGIKSDFQNQAGENIDDITIQTQTKAKAQNYATPTNYTASSQMPSLTQSQHKIPSNKNVISSEVMHDFQRYSREPAEKDQNLTDCPVPHNMKSCCRTCCVSLQKKLDAQNRPNKNCSNWYKNSCPRHKNKNTQITFCNNRQISDSHVAHRNCPKSAPLDKNNASLSKSAPINIQKNKGYSQNPRPQPDEEAPEIPLPPPPPIKNQHSKIIRQRSLTKRKVQAVVERKPSPEQPSLENSNQMYNYNYNKQHCRSYPYEEPTDSTSYTHDTCCSQNCGGYERCPQHRACKCQCQCDSDNYYNSNISDDQMSFCSDSSKSDFMNLAYQRTGDYPELVDELENTLSQRNRMRVQKTMQQFEMLSRQNKNLEKPIFDDDESLRNSRQRYRKKSGQQSNECNCPCCHANDQHECRRQNNYKPNPETYKSRSESLSKRPNFQPNSSSRNQGYVEKVARDMDPNFTDKNKKCAKSPHNEYNLPGNINGNDGGWQMDARKGEWVKVNRQNQYDFENNYPPLPPRPISGHMYDDRFKYLERHSPMDHHCSCSKCRRNR